MIGVTRLAALRAAVPAEAGAPGRGRHPVGPEVGVPRRVRRGGGWSYDVRGAERRACRSETGVPGRTCDGADQRYAPCGPPARVPV